MQLKRRLYTQCRQPGPERSSIAGSLAPSSVNGSGRSFAGRYGVFDSVDEAVAAARPAFEQLSERPVEQRRRIIDHIRRISIDQCVELGTMEMEETKIGRLEHKIAKLKTLGERTPGVEFLKTEAFSGDYGLQSSNMPPLASLAPSPR